MPIYLPVSSVGEFGNEINVFRNSVMALTILLDFLTEISGFSVRPHNLRCPKLSLKFHSFVASSDEHGNEEGFQSTRRFTSIREILTRRDVHAL